VPCVVASVHNVYTRDKKIHRRMINRYLARYTDKVVAVSGAVRKDIIKYDGLAAGKVDVIRNGVNIERFSNIDCSALKSELNIAPGVPVIGTVGRLTLQKGQKFLLESISKLKDKFPGIVLLVVGDGPLRVELEDYAEKIRIRNNVKFLGVRRDIPELLSAMDIFVLPSLWEGLTNALIEAMAAGKPVIATDIPQIREIVDSGNYGILVPVKQSDAIAQAVEQLLNDTPLAGDYGRAAYKRASSAFSIDDTVKKYTKLYENILEGKKYN
jgi:glycosyltransferase involved in cell wall biosynthesis